MKNSHIPTVRHPFMMAGDALLVVLIPIPDICVNSLYRAPPERNQGTEIFCLRHAVLISSRFSTNESRIKKALLSFAVVSSPQCDENTAFFSGFPPGGSHGQGIFPVIPLDLQGKKHQPFSRTQPISSPCFPTAEGAPGSPLCFFELLDQAQASSVTPDAVARPCTVFRWPLGKCKGGATRPNSIPTAPSALCPLCAPHRARLTKEKRSCWICS